MCQDFDYIKSLCWFVVNIHKLFIYGMYMHSIRRHCKKKQLCSYERFKKPKSFLFTSFFFLCLFFFFFKLTPVQGILSHYNLSCGDVSLRSSIGPLQRALEDSLYQLLVYLIMSWNIPSLQSNTLDFSPVFRVGRGS